MLLLVGAGLWWYSGLPITVGSAPVQQSRVLILLHGHGASKSDLEPLAQELATVLPGWRFIMPNAPERVGLTGRSWFPRTYAESGSALAQKSRQIRATTRAVVLDIVRSLTASGLAPQRIFVGGYSQGASVALDVVLSEAEGSGLGGLVSLSGGAFSVSLDNLRGRQPLRAFVSHGRNDPVLPVTMSRQLVDALMDSGHDVEFVEFAGGHQIPREVIQSLQQFLQSLSEDN